MNSRTETYQTLDGGTVDIHFVSFGEDEEEQPDPSKCRDLTEFGGVSQ